MTTRDIRPHLTEAVCDVCGRTILRGEHLEVFIGSGVRHGVCELCKTHALHEGWVREGAVPDFSSSDQGVERRRSLLGRLGRRRERSRGAQAPPGQAPAEDPWMAMSSGYQAPPDDGYPPTSVGVTGGRPPIREPRHVRAVPSSDDHRVAVAVERFNQSEHRRTVSGVARSLGTPAVTVSPDPGRPGLVWIVVAWELCWYRYEVDLSDDASPVQGVGQGYELDELSEAERRANAAADEMGVLSLL